MNKKILAVLSHPDDAELMCAGTLSLLSKAGWEIHIATMTPGDKGTTVHSREEIASIRKNEARKAAEIIGGVYHCVELEDLYILYDREAINKTASLVRNVQPSIVITSSPVCYMADHEMTSKLVQTACFACGVKNLDITEPIFEPVPYLYYVDAMEGKDKFGNPVEPAFYVDITDEMQVKETMLACHESQRNWLMEHHKMDEYILAMKRFAEIRGEAAGVTYAEGFRQHLGHGYPQDNALKEILGSNMIFKTNK